MLGARILGASIMETIKLEVRLGRKLRARRSLRPVLSAGLV